jgi:hypothetical protein
MKNITANAFINLKEIPNTLHIHGSIMTYRPDDKIRLVKTVPQGINPFILLTELVVTEGTKPMKGTPKLFKMHLRGEAAKSYNEIYIRYKDGETVHSLKIDVEVFGKQSAKTK